MKAVFLFVYIVSSVRSIAFAIEAVPFFSEQQGGMQQSEGEKQYLLIKSNANLPQYGSCWLQAIKQIDSTCAHLTDTTQATLALKFTKCFMVMSGGDAANIDSCEISDSDCVNRLPERVFQAYTHFYTHTQNICFYLMHQVWHTETEQTINLLRTHSQSVSKQLELAGRLQINLLQQQREGLKVQRQLVEHGLNLSDVLMESRGSLAKLTAQFRNSTIEHGRQLGDLFKRLAQLHNWFVGEYTFIEQILYYSLLLIVILIFTTSKRAANCRFFLFLLAALNLTLECVVQKYFGIDYFVEDLQITLYNRLWIIRKIVIAVMIIIYGTMTMLYVDSNRLTVNLLNRISEQNNEILQLLNELKAPSNGANTETKTKTEKIEIRKQIEHSHRTSPYLMNQILERYQNIKSVGISNVGQTMDVLPESNFDRIREEIGVASRLRPRRTTPKI